MKKLLAGLLFVPVISHAAFKTGNDLWMDMTSKDYFGLANSIGYITGVADTARGYLYCPPADGGGITAGQMQDMVKNYLQANPQIRNFNADLIVINVLKQAWPCANKTPGRGA